MRCCHVRPFHCRALLAAVLAVSAVAPGAHAGDGSEALGGFWGDIGAGAGYLNAGSAPGDISGSGYWIDGVVGGRLGDQWLLGFNLGGIGVNLSNRNDRGYDYYGSNVYGQTVTNLFLAAQFEPLADHGFYFGFGGGRVLYHDRVLEIATGNYESGRGYGGIARLGFDWRVGARVHVETQLSVEAGNISLGSPLTGSFGYSAVMLSVHVAHH